MYGVDLAYVHDAGFSGFARAAAPWILQQLHAAAIDRGRIVELGCGTGRLARVLSSTGYQVTGIDVSAGMLAIARRVAPRAEFRRASIHEVRVPQCDAIVAIGEAVAYLPSNGLRRHSLARLFVRAARSLPAGGLFMFDVVVREGGAPLTYRTYQSGEDWAALVDSREHAGIVTRQITTFRAVRGGYRRGEERHDVAVYRTGDIVRWLERAGFSVKTRRGYGPSRLPPRRLAFIARRVAIPRSRGGERGPKPKLTRVE
jgi:SAM-dependent methyltransferase